MGFTLPTVDDFKGQFDRDFPFAVPSFGAKATPNFGPGGAIASATVVAVGEGYTDKPTVIAVDPAGTGSGAVLVASVSNGALTGVAVSNGGNGYSSETTLVFSGGSGSATDMTRVRDRDIQNAINDAKQNFNEGLFDNQTDYARAFCYLAAHYLVERLLAAGEGFRSRFNWLTTSKSAGELSEAYGVPESVLQNPFAAMISKTRYGALYLSIVYPLTIGSMFTSFRQTPP